jgi:thiamine biosynthesis protein ThiS
MTVNGKPVEYEPVTLLDYLLREGFNPSHVVVERINASADAPEIITRERFGEVTLAEGDEINILRFMGGG